MEQKILKQQNFDRLWKAISPQFCENLGLWELASARPWRGRLGTLFVRPVQALDFPQAGCTSAQQAILHSRTGE